MSYLYIIYNGQHYKIGVSCNPERRLKQLQTASATPLRLIKTYPVEAKLVKRLEQQLHKMFWQSRTRHKGEWFDLTDAHLDCIEDWLKTI